jgi:hypothetical protein
VWVSKGNAIDLADTWARKRNSKASRQVRASPITHAQKNLESWSTAPALSPKSAMQPAASTGPLKSVLAYVLGIFGKQLPLGYLKETKMYFQNMLFFYQIRHTLNYLST